MGAFKLCRLKADPAQLECAAGHRRRARARECGAISRRDRSPPVVTRVPIRRSRAGEPAPLNSDRQPHRGHVLRVRGQSERNTTPPTPEEQTRPRHPLPVDAQSALRRLVGRGPEPEPRIRRGRSASPTGGSIRSGTSSARWARSGGVVQWLGHRELKLIQHYFHLHDKESSEQMRRISLFDADDGQDGRDLDGSRYDIYSVWAGAGSGRINWHSELCQSHESREKAYLSAFFGARCGSNGEAGIRTLGGLTAPPVFKTGALDHSATSPGAAVL